MKIVCIKAKYFIRLLNNIELITIQWHFLHFLSKFIALKGAFDELMCTHTAQQNDKSTISSSGLSKNEHLHRLVLWEVLVWTLEKFKEATQAIYS